MTCIFFRKRPILSLALASALLGASGFLLVLQAQAIRDVRDLSLPLAASVLPLERRSAHLSRAIEFAEAHRQARSGALEEKLRAYSLPATFERDRIVALLDVMASALRAERMIDGTPSLDFHDHRERDAVDGLALHPLTLSVTITQDGLHDLLLLLEHSGLLTVSDLFSASERREMMTLLEAGNPADIALLEQFFSADLLYYSRETRALEGKFFGSLSSPATAELLRRTIDSSDRTEIRALLAGPVGDRLQEARLWPMAFLTVEEVVMEKGEGEWYRAALQMKAYTRRW